MTDLKERKDAHTLGQYRKAREMVEDAAGAVFLAAIMLMSLLLLTGFAEP